MENIIEIRNLVKKFGSLTAVNRVNFEIKEGEIFGLLGPNGAGKTTTVNMLLTLSMPTSGKILVAGMDAQKNREKVKQLMGLMTQEVVVENDLTVRENLEFFAMLYHIPEKSVSGKIDRALGRVGLLGSDSIKAGTLSGGLQHRLGLARSMLQEPRILVLDEPTTGLDVQNRVAIWEHIRELNSKGTTVVLTTHYLEEVDALCDRVAIIDRGVVKAIGTVPALKQMVGRGRILDILFADSGDAVKAQDLMKTRLGMQSTVKGEKLSSTIGEWDPKILVKILSAMESRNIEVVSANARLPTLDDVFMKLTGSALGKQPEGEGR